MNYMYNIALPFCEAKYLDILDISFPGIPCCRGSGILRSFSVHRLFEDLSLSLITLRLYIIFVWHKLVEFPKTTFK